MSAFPVDMPRLDVFTAHLPRVQMSRDGQSGRAGCPCCGGTSRKLSFALKGDAIVFHCFGGCRPDEVLGAMGLRWGDILPPRHWPQTPQERRDAHRAMRQAGWSAALGTLATEATVVLAAGRQLVQWQHLSEEDDARLEKAVERIGSASTVLIDGATWRPAHEQA